MNQLHRCTRRLISSVLLLALYTGNVLAGQPDTARVTFENKTRDAGLIRYTPTFSIVVSDIDNDGVDDLFVGHHGFPPMLYLNRGLNFVAQPDALPRSLKVHKDRHGYTFIDFDNDGDKDFVVAGGGADGIGKGQGNEVYKNLLVETGKLEFVDVTADSDIGNPRGRTRLLLPIPNAKGDKVDLYSVGLHQGRKGSKNLYAVNNSTATQIRFNSDEKSSLHQTIESDGKDLFFDYDRDGFADFLSVGHGQAVLYHNNSGEFAHLPSVLDKIWGVISAVSADLNNDGFPDLYLGGANGHTTSDQVSSNSEEIHFSVQNQGDDTSDGIAFTSAPGRLKINFTEHIPSLGKTRTDATNIFIGANRDNPKHRTAQIGRARAAGKPANMADDGIYIWFEDSDESWHVLWKHDEKSVSETKGIIYAQGIEQLEKHNLETVPGRTSQDYILINQRGNGWNIIKQDDLQHDEWTNHLTAADFNNDGFIDIAGVRTRDDAQENGNPFIVLNHGDLTFTTEEILQNPEDDIFRADLIVHGFFNDNGLPDLFYTNGFGLLPGHMGPYQFWLNSTDTRNGYVLLELEGTTSNRDAIGAQLELYDMEQQLLGYRELGSDFGRGQNTHKVHFGVGDRKGPFYLSIRWPGSSEPQRLLVTGNSYYHIRQD
jgi:hypothetical protein